LHANFSFQSYLIDTIPTCENPASPESTCFQSLTLGVQSNAGFVVWINTDEKHIYASSNMPAEFTPEDYATSAAPTNIWRTTHINFERFIRTRQSQFRFVIGVEVHIPMDSTTLLFNAYLDADCSSQNIHQISLVDIEALTGSSRFLKFQIKNKY
jgi:hypothetical protein